MANWVSAGCGVIANELAQAMEKREEAVWCREPYAGESSSFCKEIRCAECIYKF